MFPEWLRDFQAVVLILGGYGATESCIGTSRSRTDFIPSNWEGGWVELTDY